MKKPTRLKICLVNHGIKQGELAEKTGIPADTISRIVNGQVPHLWNAIKIARVLNTTVEELWSLPEDESNNGGIK